MTRIAFFHNRYRTRGGEDRVVDLEMDLLRKAGHEVHAFLVDSRDLRGPADTLRAGWESNWSHAMGRRVARFLDAHPVDVGHVHNFFPLLTPVVHDTLRSRGVPVVQTLHNYRLVCANGLFLREGRPCEECVARGPWNAVRHGCYRGSRLQTAAWARAATRQRARGLWRTLVDRFVAPSDFLRRKLVAAGLPDERFVVKPNPVPDPGPPAAVGQGAVYVGRLSPEKGVRLLLEAWRELEGESLTVVGTGAEESELRRIGRDLPGVRFTGELAPDRVQEELARAAFLVAPSLCYENFPLAVAEAFAAGRPVVASHPSALSDLVEDGRTGLRFATGSAAELASACRRLAGSPALCAELGREARQRYEDELTPERCAAHLEEIYGALLR
ncbi:MAG: glycosyltransferase family 4 protein [Myxococcota bacterium]|nr:glycosyltransferase family 4 protein [Myxococcota bacterium]